MEPLFDHSLASSRNANAVPMDLYRTGDHYVVRVDLPGPKAKPRRIQVAHGGGTKTIEADQSSEVTASSETDHVNSAAQVDSR